MTRVRRCLKMNIFNISTFLLFIAYVGCIYIYTAWDVPRHILGGPPSSPTMLLSYRMHHARSQASQWIWLLLCLKAHAKHSYWTLQYRWCYWLVSVLCCVLSTPFEIALCSKRQISILKLSPVPTEAICDCMRVPYTCMEYEPYSFLNSFWSPFITSFKFTCGMASPYVIWQPMVKQGIVDDVCIA